MKHIVESPFPGITCIYPYYNTSVEISFDFYRGERKIVSIWANSYLRALAVFIEQFGEKEVVAALLPIPKIISLQLCQGLK